MSFTVFSFFVAIFKCLPISCESINLQLLNLSLEPTFNIVYVPIQQTLHYLIGIIAVVEEERERTVVLYHKHACLQAKKSKNKEIVDQTQK